MCTLPEFARRALLLPKSGFELCMRYYVYICEDSKAAEQVIEKSAQAKGMAIMNAPF